MFEMTITIDASDTLGKLDEMLNKFMELQNVIEPDMDNAMILMVDVAKELCPVDTGKLQDSIRYEGSFPVYELIADAQNDKGQFYGKYVEFGTMMQGAQPFLYPAFREVSRQLINTLRRHIREFISGRG